eukprot:g2717.t1
MGKSIKILNKPTAEAIECARDLVKKDASAKGDSLTNEQLLLGSMAYTKSAIDYAAHTPAEVLDVSPDAKHPQEVGITERTINGAILTHLNKEKFKRCIDYVLKIELGSLSNIIDKDFLGGAGKNFNSDPFVVFTTGVSMETSKVLYNKANATWNSTHYLFVRKNTIFDGGRQKLNIHVLDCDTTKLKETASLVELNHYSDILGSTAYDIKSELDKNGRHPLTVYFDTKESKKKEKMKLDIHYEQLTIDQYLEETKKKDGTIWFDGHPLPIRDEKVRKLFEAHEVTSVDLKPLLYFDNPHTSTQGWIHADIHKKDIIIVFKEADCEEKKDFFTEVKSDLAPLIGMDIDDYTLKPTENLKKSGDQKIHHGFRDAYISVRESLLETVHSFCQNWDERWLLVFTGQAMGGALACIAAYEFANRTSDGKKVKVAMLNYGAPRVANDPFVMSYTETVPVSFRFRYKEDTLPCYPRKLKHVPNLVTFKPDKTCTFVFPGPEKPVDPEDDEDDNDDKCAGHTTVNDAIATYKKIRFTYTITVTVAVEVEYYSK